MAIEAEAAQQDRAGRLAEQRRGLPDQPGVYLFRDVRGRLIYVGKAKSIRKRVASHFSNPTLYGTRALTDEVDNIEALVVATEAEALLTEQTFIKQYKPRFNIRLRDDKSYPYIAISLDEDFPRAYFTRERHARARLLRPLLERQARPQHARAARQGLPAPLLQGPRARPAHGLAVPGLLHQALRGALRRLHLQGGVPARRRRRHRLPARPLQADRARPRAHMNRSGEQDYEQAALERNRLHAVRALLERQRVANEGVGTSTRSRSPSRARTPTPRSSRSATASSPTASRSTSTTRPSAAGDGGRGVPRPVLRQLALDPVPDHRPGRARHRLGVPILAEILAARRGGSVEIRAAERGDKRRILELAERNAQLALDQERLKAERRRQQRVESLDGLQGALRLDTLPVRVECFDISHLRGTHTTASMVVFEGGAPKKSDYRRFNIREVDPGDDYAAMGEVLSRRHGQWEKQAERSPYDAERDPSFGALPNLIVIDGGMGQLAAGLEALVGFRERGVAVISLAKRIEEVFLPGRRAPVALPHDTRSCSCFSACATRRIASPSRPPDPARQGDDRVDHGRPAGHGAGAQARAARALRLARRRARRHARGARARARRAAEGRARSLRSNLQDRAMSRRSTRDTSSVASNGRGPSRLVDFVIISGLSGAGKSSAMNVFEDAGYFCVDNLPAEMIRSLAELFRHPGSKVERAAVVWDSRGGEYLSALTPRDRRARRGRHRPPRAVPGGRRADAAEPLQGDAAAASAGAARQRGGRHRERA